LSLKTKHELKKAKKKEEAPHTANDNAGAELTKATEEEEVAHDSAKDAKTALLRAAGGGRGAVVFFFGVFEILFEVVPPSPQGGTSATQKRITPNHCMACINCSTPPVASKIARRAHSRCSGKAAAQPEASLAV
jgi:hypothetical protein